MLFHRNSLTFNILKFQDLVRDWKIIQNTSTLLLGGDVNPSAAPGKTRIPLKGWHTKQSDKGSFINDHLPQTYHSFM